MKKKFIEIICAIAFIITIIAIIATQRVKIDRLTTENTRLKDNQEILIENSNAIEAECRKYRVSDSLNAYKVSELRLKLDEYKKYRAEDLKLIRKLKLDKTDMQKVIDSQASTIYDLSTSLKDTVIIANTDTSHVKAFEYTSKWVDVYGQIDLGLNNVNLNVHSREELMVVESVQYKRFLGFLWKTKKIKKREVDVLSKNPNTTIVSVDYVSIEK